jgi:SAM-dependent methyltransferase
LVALAALSQGARVLEIGCGTGKATLPLLERGLDVTCVELGERLAEVARRKLSAFSRVEVVNAAFETWEPREAGFDAVVAFTAFHWVDPAVRYAKSAELLDPAGSLAVVGTKHVLPEDGDPFFVDVQEDYVALRATPQRGDGPPPRPEEVPDLEAEIEASGAFRHVAARRYVWDIVYTADEYVAVLDTYSGHRALEPALRSRLYDRIRRRIDGTVRKTYLATLNIARVR